MPGEKDRIKFSQLAHAINRGVRKGYSEEDICEEVIRITSPDIPLREMLEGNENLTIAKLRKILRTHFHEKDSSKLFEELQKASQNGSQDATQFVQSLIRLKQRILFVSKEIGSSVQFSEAAVNTQFVRSLLSGLKNNNIRNDLKAVVTTEMEDEDLLELLDVAVTNEEERLQKWGASASAKSAVINRVDSEVDSLNVSSSSDGSCSSCSQKPNVKHQPKNDHNPILNKLEEIQVTVNRVATFEEKLDKVDLLEKEVADLKKQVGNQSKRKGKFGCDTCRENHRARSCKHCYSCGGA